MNLSNNVLQMAITSTPMLGCYGS